MVQNHLLTGICHSHPTILIAIDDANRFAKLQRNISVRIYFFYCILIYPMVSYTYYCLQEQVLGLLARHEVDYSRRALAELPSQSLIYQHTLSVPCQSPKHHGKDIQVDQQCSCVGNNSKVSKP